MAPTGVATVAVTMTGGVTVLVDVVGAELVPVVVFVVVVVVVFTTIAGAGLNAPD